MHRIAQRGLTLVTLVAVATTVQAKKAAAPPAGPVSVELHNTCGADLTVLLAGTEIKVATGARSTGVELAPREDWSYEVKMQAPSKADLGLLGLRPDGRYAIEVAGCRPGGADLLTRDLGDKPAAKSPQEAAEVRFRARQNGFIEYRTGKMGGFKPLSIAMTNYVEQAGGALEFTFRLRAARGGPVLKMLKTAVDLQAGHRYLIEVNVVGNDLLFKHEDEGWREG